MRAVSAGLSLLCLGAEAATYASVRSDVWVKSLPESNTPDPKDGRRVHVSIEGCGALANITKDQMIQSVTVNGAEGIDLQGIAQFDWLRAHANPELRSLWISFHTHDVSWLGSRVVSGSGRRRAAPSSQGRPRSCRRQRSHAVVRRRAVGRQRPSSTCTTTTNRAPTTCAT